MRKPLVVIDVSGVADARHLHRLLAEGLAFPAWYGRNWDAFWDAITGLVDMPERLRFVGWHAFERRFGAEARIVKACLDRMSEAFPTCAAQVEYA
jgi:RNAse (barnase) inhibitor barstar